MISQLTEMERKQWAAHVRGTRGRLIEKDMKRTPFLASENVRSVTRPWAAMESHMEGWITLRVFLTALRPSAAPFTAGSSALEGP